MWWEEKLSKEQKEMYARRMRSWAFAIGKETSLGGTARTRPQRASSA